jgi:hypothetical protein
MSSALFAYFETLFQTSHIALETFGCSLKPKGEAAD